jgi:hypothetical protein
MQVNVALVATAAAGPGQPPAVAPGTIVFGGVAPAGVAPGGAATAGAAHVEAPATHPTTQPNLGISVVMTPATRPSDLADPWKPVLQNLGVSEGDSAVIVGIIAGTLRDSHKLAGVYLMDQAEFDHLLPLDVVPEPRTIQRIGIVIVRNADPNAGSDVDDWIAQLADPDWSKRDEAYQALAKIGPSALVKLQAATKSKDVEVVWRAEKLIATMGQGKPQGGR